MEGAGVMFRLGFALILILSNFGGIYSLTPASTITAFDRDRLQTLFQNALASNKLEDVAYGVKGLQVLTGKLAGNKICDVIKKNLNPNDVTSIYFATEVAKLAEDIGACQVSWGSSESTLIASLKNGASSETVHYAVDALNFLGKQIPKEVTTILSGALQTDDTASSYAHAFYAAAHLPKDDALKFHNMIEDVIAQADEVGDVYYQYSDLATTSLVIDSVYSLSKTLKLQPAVSEDKVVKFGNYLLSRKFVVSCKEASFLVSALQGLSSNGFYVPISTYLHGPVSISAKSPNVVVMVSDLLGNPVKGVSVVAESGRHIDDNAVILSKKPLVQSAVDSSLYELDLYGLKPAIGFYKISLSSTSAPNTLKLLGNQETEVVVKVTTSIEIGDVEILVVDKEQGTTLRNLKVDSSKKFNLEADFHQKILLKFVVKDVQSGKLLTPHQTFVRMVREKTQQEVMFVAEEDASKTYKFDLDISAKGKDFNGLSGKYSLDLIVGDAVFENSVSWQLGDVKLTFNEDVVTPKADVYSKKPEISHIFREPEKRPPTFVSNLFTALVALPFLILLLLWVYLGANFSNFPFSLSAVGFHLGVGAIFGLYGMYFWKFNMFETLKYLGVIGLPTFLFGHRLLSKIASTRK